MHDGLFVCCLTESILRVKLCLISESVIASNPIQILSFAFVSIECENLVIAVAGSRW